MEHNHNKSLRSQVSELLSGPRRPRRTVWLRADGLVEGWARGGAEKGRSQTAQTGWAKGGRVDGDEGEPHMWLCWAGLEGKRVGVCMEKPGWD